MTFEERRAQAARLLIDFLSTFTPPRGVDEDGQGKLVTQIADAFARRMPTRGDFDEACDKVFQKVRDTHVSNSWPSQAEFVMAMPQDASKGGKAAETYKPDNYRDWIEEAMSEGREVPEAAIWGPNSSGVQPQLLEAYRRSSVHSWREFYGNEAQSMMVARYGHAVLPYFSRRASA